MNNNTIIKSRAPVRISFAGGGTDISPYCDENGGVVINATINKYVYATLSWRDDDMVGLHSYDFNEQIISKIEDLKYDGNLDLIKAVVKHFNISGIDIYLRSEVPVRSGLGGSATAFIAVIGLYNHLLKENGLTDYEIAELAFKLEREELKNSGGRQDQYASVFGGINLMEFYTNDFVKITPMKISEYTLLEMERNIIIANIGERQSSGDIIEDQTNNYKTGVKKTISALDKNKELAHDIKRALLKGDLNYFGVLVDKAWEEKKNFSKYITNDRIDKLFKTAKENGALGGKITGAGGGGHVIFYCKPKSEHSVARALEQHGAKILPFSFDFGGLKTWETENENN